MWSRALVQVHDTPRLAPIYIVLITYQNERDASWEPVTRIPWEKWNLQSMFYPCISRCPAHCTCDVLAPAWYNGSRPVMHLVLEVFILLKVLCIHEDLIIILNLTGNMKPLIMQLSGLDKLPYRITIIKAPNQVALVRRNSWTQVSRHFIIHCCHFLYCWLRICIAANMPSAFLLLPTLAKWYHMAWFFFSFLSLSLSFLFFFFFFFQLTVL